MLIPLLCSFTTYCQTISFINLQMILHCCGWFVLCRIIVFSGRKGEKAPRENPPNGDFFVFLPGDLSPRHTKVRRFLCVAFSPPVCRIFAWWGERSPRENPPNDDFFVFKHGDLSSRHTKVRDIPCVAFSATVCRIFAWRGERSPCENPTKSPFGGFSRATFRVFAMKTRLYYITA